MKKTILLFAIALFGAVSVAQAQLPAVTLKDINGNTVKTGTVDI
jgi:cytochrome c biogenesis protein CcmG/thiol:disulfide interchange protein DsbE